MGIDEYGFLKVRKSSDGEVVILHTDVHSFDVRQSIIREKAMWFCFFQKINFY